MSVFKPDITTRLRPSARSTPLLALVSLGLVGMGCLERERVGDVGAPNLATVQSLIFTPRCATADCHGGADPKKGLNLEPGKSVDSLVGVLAEQAPSLYRVAPGDSESSYLMNKLRGSMDDVGGSGEIMPLDGTPLSAAELDLVAAWIDGLTVALPAPVITSTTPSAASSGALVLIGGQNFGLQQSDSVVTFGGMAATASAWSATSIEAAVPSGSAPGSAPLVVTVAGQASAAFPFEVLSGSVPSIIGLIPDTSIVGGEVQVRGSNFGATQGTSVVTFGAIAAATYPSWAANSIHVIVPVGATISDVTVTVAGVSSNAVAFWVVEPTLSSIQEAVFSRRCAVTCHDSPVADPTPATDCPPAATTGSLDLRAGMSHTGLVGVDSCMLPGTLRVTAGDRAASLLYLKLLSASPPAGAQMPLDATPLTPEVIEVVGVWIDLGAMND